MRGAESRYCAHTCAQATKEELGRRRAFEDAIKRPYFHVKPLDGAQLAAWGRYLDYAEPRLADAPMRRLFERCLVACACYVGAPRPPPQLRPRRLLPALQTAQSHCSAAARSATLGRRRACAGVRGAQLRGCGRARGSIQPPCAALLQAGARCAAPAAALMRARARAASTALAAVLPAAHGAHACMSLYRLSGNRAGRVISTLTLAQSSGRATRAGWSRASRTARTTRCAARPTCTASAARRRRCWPLGRPSAAGAPPPRARTTSTC